MRFLTSTGLALALLGASACNVNVEESENSTAEANSLSASGPATQSAQVRDQARAPLENLRFIVDKSDREVRAFTGDRLIARHAVSVGTTEYPTPNGSWEFNQVDINPEWIPPDSEWAKDEERQGPGDPENPMGRARLIYNMPYTIHGTDELDSLGNRESHGSIRVANSVVLELAQLLLKAGGAWEGDQWFQQMTQTRDRQFEIELADPVPVVVQD